MLIAGSLFILVIAEVGSSDRKIAWLKMFNFFINKKCICLVNSKITKDDHESLYYVPYIKFNFLTSETATINNLCKRLSPQFALFSKVSSGLR